MAEDLSIGRTLGGGAGAKEGGWTLAPGETLGGYRVVKPLGRGGMGEVYLAENIQTGVEFALKLLPSDLARDNAFRERFRREAGLLQTLRHDGIVQVLHAAEEGGRFFLTMDYVDGGSLEDRLRERAEVAVRGLFGGHVPIPHTTRNRNMSPRSHPAASPRPKPPGSRLSFATRSRTRTGRA